MSRAIEFLNILGKPVRSGESDLIRSIGIDWGVDIPDDFAEIAGEYGDSVISEYIFFCGSRNLSSFAKEMGPVLEASEAVPNSVLPTPGGGLLWGNTIEGDRLFLIPNEDGRWTVSAYRRNWYDWYQSDLEFGAWFLLALTGKIATDWLPEWDALPHVTRRAV